MCDREDEMTITGYDPYSPVALDDPYPFYAWLREEAPLYFPPQHGFAIVSRYEDVVAVARNPQDFSSAKGIGPAVVDDTRNMIELDPPDHTRLRRLVQKAFTPRSIALWEERIRGICNELLDQFVDAGQCDFMTEFATPLPVRIIAEMLGVEPERMDDFKRWSDAVVDALVADPKTLDKETFVATLREMNAYFRTIVETRRAEPRDDLTTALVQAREKRDALSDVEILGSMLLLLVAGNETTTNLIGNGTVAITADEEQRQAVRDDPSLWPNAVEEIVRFDGPIQGTFRTTTRDVQMHGITIPERSKVLVLWGSADRDPRRYPDPDRFDVRRDVSGHVAFGSGIHLCLGAPLARLEGRIAIETVVGRIKNVNVEGKPTRRPNPFFRGFEHLPITFEPVS
jgi:cytochrome P450